MSRALLIIDMQKFVEDRINQGVQFYPSNAINNMTIVLRQFRKEQALVAHVVHQTAEEGSVLHQDSPFYPAIGDFEPTPDERVFIKRTSSAFASTDLKHYLEAKGISEVVVMGAVAGFCVNSTVRHGSDLGLKMTVVKDAVISFDLPDAQREEKNIHDVTMKLLEAGFARMVFADAV
ncbi:isochorismatase family protein [Enterobacteriaceae bacterium H4N4]|uniref:Isochorismatase family protein n=1 Tax=Silvania confinis TaxID=2926470 RepID=A0A9J6QT60_9ENTR|nr:isochorismatase family protein [Silvania confinis]MCU6671573.1 isochorismatase family protein [Silvania confinis]